MSRLYISDCGGYICRVPEGESWGSFEAWAADGSIHWECDRRIKTWEDQKKFRRPLKYAVGSYSATLTGQKPGSFTLGLLQCNPRKVIKPFTGNTIVESRDVVFRRKIQANHTAAWLRKVGAA